MDLEPEKRIREEKQVREDRNICMQISSLVPFLVISVRKHRTRTGSIWLMLPLYQKFLSRALCAEDQSLRCSPPNPEVLLASMAPCRYKVSLTVVCSLHLSGQRPLGTVQWRFILLFQTAQTSPFLIPETHTASESHDLEEALIDSRRGHTKSFNEGKAADPFPLGLQSRPLPGHCRFDPVPSGHATPAAVITSYFLRLCAHPVIPRQTGTLTWFFCGSAICSTEIRQSLVFMQWMSQRDRGKECHSCWLDSPSMESQTVSIK